MLSVYPRPHDPKRPLVCLDEASKHLTKETRSPLPRQPGQPACFAYADERNGTAHGFMLCAPLEGWRHVEVTERRTAVDSAHIRQELSETPFPDTERIVRVQDNLNTHGKASLYEAFAPQEARRLVERFAWHSTPKHGSWLHRAESELAHLASQCLDRRLPDKETLAREVAAWQGERNTNHTKADWPFSTEKARIKLTRLYPVI